MIRFLGLCLVGGGLLLATQLGKAGLMEGSFRQNNVRVQKQGKLVIDKGPQSLGKRALFKGGERACVIVMGDHKPVAPLILEIRDDKGNVVGKDEPAAGTEKTDTPGNDLAAVIWYPPRDGYYSIIIMNPAPEYNDCWLVIK
jgi:hypothetical protein